jgi:hypothetical protein
MLGIKKIAYLLFPAAHSFSGSVLRGEIYRPKETCNFFEHHQAARLKLEFALSRIHPHELGSVAIFSQPPQFVGFFA